MLSVKRILCPIDFSEGSGHALARAAAIAKDQAATVTALHVVPTESPLLRTAPLEVTPPVLPALSPADRERVLQALEAFVTNEAGAGTPIDAEVVEAPTIHGEILAQARRLHADLIVMGTHGRSGFQRLLLGSVTEKVLRTALEPVLTVGARIDAAAGGSPSFKRILCAVDFSECSIAALKYALALADGAVARVTVVNVVEWTPIGYDPLVGPPTDLVGYRMAVENASRERLHNAVAESNLKGIAIEEIVTSGKPHHEVLRIAAEQDSDLIVLGIHGRNPVNRMLFGSTAEPVVRRAECPVLTVRADAARKIAAA